MGTLLTPEALQAKLQQKQPTSTGTIPTPTSGMSPLQSILAQQVLSGKITGSDVTALTSLGMLPPQETEDQAKKKTAKLQAEKLLTALEDSYFKNNLAKGNNAKGVMADINAWARINPNDPYVQWRDLMESKRPTLAKAAGDSGNLAFQEQLQAGKPFPSARSDPRNAQNRFNMIRAGFGLPERDFSQLNNYVPTGLEELGKQYGF